MPTFGMHKGRNKHAGKDLQHRPLGLIKSGKYSGEEMKLALQILREAFEESQTETPNGRPVIHVSEWQRRCERAGLEKPGKFRALSFAAMSQGVTVDTDGRVHWGLFTENGT
jgi:hypothetical protein